MYPDHLLSGSLKCGACGGAIVQVGGKAGGYYGCQMAHRRGRCSNHLTLSRQKLEDYFISVLFEKVLKLDNLKPIFASMKKALEARFADIPQELKTKTAALTGVEREISNYIDALATGNKSAAIFERLKEAEERKTSLKKTIQSLELQANSIPQMPDETWIRNKLKNLKKLLEQKETKSAMEVQRLIGKIVLTPAKNEKGQKYYFAQSKLKTFSLLDGSENGSPMLQWWRWGESNPRPRNFNTGHLHV